MFRQMWTVVLAVFALVVAASCCAAAAAADNVAVEEKMETNSIGMKLILIPKGEFMMGNGHKAEDQSEAPSTVLRRHDREVLRPRVPAHRVRITKPFRMGAYHVTVGQFRQFVKATDYKTEAEEGGEGAAGSIRQPAWQPFTRSRGGRGETSGSSRPMTTRWSASVGTTPWRSASG